jgi:hypothetical protein
MALISCRCGKVEGTLAKASRRSVNRVICYCADCQRFSKILGRDDLLDAAGGSDIVQVAAGRLAFQQGGENIRAIRLSPDGTFRWYAKCCMTPLGNIASHEKPAIGIHALAFRSQGQAADHLFGPPIGGIRGEHAVGPVPRSARGLPVRVTLSAVPKVLMWKLMKADRPNPFFGSSGKPNFPIRFPEDC